MDDCQGPSKKRWWEESWEDYDWDSNGWSSSWWEEDPWYAHPGGSRSSTDPNGANDMDIEPWSLGHAVPSLSCIAEVTDEEGILEDPAEPDEEGILEEWELDDEEDEEGIFEEPQESDDVPIPMEVDLPRPAATKLDPISAARAQAAAVNFLYFLNVLFFVNSLCPYLSLDKI